MVCDAICLPEVTAILPACFRAYCTKRFTNGKIICENLREFPVLAAFLEKMLPFS